MYGDNKRMVLSIFWVLLGLVLIILSVLEVLDSAYYSGMGGALVAVGMIQTFKHIKYKKDAVYKNKIDIEANDERNKYIRMLSWSWTGCIIVLVFALGSLFCHFLGQELLMQYFAMSVCLILVVYWVSYLILSRKY